MSPEAGGTESSAARERRAGRFTELDARERRAVARRSVVRLLVLTSFVVVLYVLWPVRPASAPTWELVRVLLTGLTFGALFVWELRRIVRAELPEVRGVEVLVMLAVIFVVLASVSYLEISAADPTAFSEPMDKVGALYFSTTVLTTVGFGDIHAVSSGARIAVTAQMVLDLVFIGVAAKLVVAAVHANLDRSDDDRTASA